ncbi:MAG: hypothetical protein OEV66_11815 [Spirochaetia bacterium]|nr:hypothetical protein [Spirochaetia bacterium]
MKKTTQTATAKKAKAKIRPSEKKTGAETQVEASLEQKAPRKRNHLRAILIGVFAFCAFALHLFLAQGSAAFFTKLFHGDIIYIANVVLIFWVLNGWFFVYKFAGKLK